MYPINFFLRTARAFPDRIAAQNGNLTITYGEMLQRVTALAAAFQEIAPDGRARIGICAQNSIGHLVALLAVLAAGRIWVPLDARSGKAELARMVDFTEPAIVVVDEALIGNIEPGRAGVFINRPDDSNRRDEDDIGSLIHAYAGRKPAENSLPSDETQAIKFTGGTTGPPKGVMQPYRAWNTNIVTTIACYGLTGEDRYLAAAPISHGTSTYMLPMFGVGGRIVLQPSTKPDAVLDTIERDRITITFMPPTLIYSVMEEFRRRRRDMSSMKHLIYAAAPMRPEMIREAQRIFGGIATNYGQTEAPVVITFLSAEEMVDERNLRSIGRQSLLTEVRIMDPAGNILGPGETGEIVARGDLIMSGYWRQPDKTAETLVDGWLHTGDGGLIDERGYVFLKDRIKDFIISGGFNIYPSDIENVLGTHPAVYDCAVVGIDDDKWGEAVHAAVRLHDRHSASEEELIGFIKARLDSIKAPKRIHFFSQLPQSTVGKTAKKEIKLQIQDRIKQTGDNR